MQRFSLLTLVLVLVGCTREIDYRQELAWQYYDCQSDGIVKARYPNENRAQLRLDEDDQVLRMQRRQSASGVKYGGGELIWWTQGDKAALYERGAETPNPLRDCRRTKPDLSAH